MIWSLGRSNRRTAYRTSIRVSNVAWDIGKHSTGVEMAFRVPTVVVNLVGMILELLRVSRSEGGEISMPGYPMAMVEVSTTFIPWSILCKVGVWVWVDRYRSRL